MIKHIVFYSLRDDCDKVKAVGEIRAALEPLQQVVPGLLCMQIRKTVAGSAYDYVLYSEFASQQALLNYQKDPRHLAVKPLVHGYICQRVSADFEQ